MGCLTGKDIEFAKQLLIDGEVVAIPTETVYGLAGNALDTMAVAKIFEVKQRPYFNPLICHIPSFDKASLYCKHIPDMAFLLAEKFMPGSLTLVLDKTDLIPDIVSGGLDTVGLRVPNHPLTLNLLQTLSFPLAAPSANPFGYISPVTATHVAEQLGEKIKYILDGGTCTVGIESTIIGFENGNPVLYRYGGVGTDEIEDCLGYKVSVKVNNTKIKSSGQLDNHYAPNTLSYNFERNCLDVTLINANDFVICFNSKLDCSAKNIEVLSENSNLKQAASRLFELMRKADKLDCDKIWIELAPNIGLGLAINDRIKRASITI